MLQNFIVFGQNTIQKCQLLMTTLIEIFLKVVDISENSWQSLSINYPIEKDAQKKWNFPPNVSYRKKCGFSSRTYPSRHLLH